LRIFLKKKSITKAQMAQARMENVFHKVKLGFEEDDENIPSQRVRWSGPFSRKKTRIFHSQRADGPGFWEDSS
jgi:sugar (pentulose or hexulose) kinase